MTGAVLTLLTAPAILALVNLLKGLGLGGRWSALAAVLLGVGVALVEHYAPADPVQTLTPGLIIGLSAAGLYDATAKPATMQPDDGYTPERAEEVAL